MVDLHSYPMRIMGKQGQMMETTNRGFPVLRFVDADGDACSIQDSSIAERDCIWLGRNDQTAARMHLTTDMAAEILERLEAGEACDVVFDDLYGSTCLIAIEEGDGRSMRLGTTKDFEGKTQRPMRISQEQAGLLEPLLSTFVETGSING